MGNCCVNNNEDLTLDDIIKNYNKKNIEKIQEDRNIEKIQDEIEEDRNIEKKQEEIEEDRNIEKKQEEIEDKILYTNYGFVRKNCVYDMSTIK